MKHIIILCLSLFTISGYAQLANLYPNDVGIESDTNVLYVEKFDDGMTNILGRYTDVLNSAGMSLDTDVPPGSLGPNSLKITNVGGVNSGGHLYKKFTPGWDSTLYVRYYVKYPLISNGYISHESVWLGGYYPATNWPNPQAGTCGLGSSRMGISYEPVNEPAMDTYLYWGDMQSWNGGSSCYGNDMVNGSPTAQNLSWDQWICVEIMVKLNNPVTAYNGELRVWQNGVEVGYWGPGFPNGHWLVDSWINNPTDPPFPGFRWRTDANLKLNYIWIEYYDNMSPSSISRYIKYDHLVIAKKYIGPIQTGAGIGNNFLVDSIMQIYPNPSGGKTIIEFSLAGTSQVSIDIYNLLGEKVLAVENGIFLSGKHTAVFDAKNLPAGTYFIKLLTPGYSLTKKIVITK